MKQIFFILTFLFFTFAGWPSYSQTTDSTYQNSRSVYTDTLSESSNSINDEPIDDFSPGIVFAALLVTAFILACVGAGIVLTVLSLLILFGLVSFGVLSTSVIIGIYKKSFAKGFKTFIVLSSSIGGLLLCSTGFWLVNKVTHWWTTQTAVLTGAACGLIAGLLFGLFAFFILQKLTTYFKQRLNLTNGNSSAI